MVFVDLFTFFAVIQGLKNLNMLFLTKITHLRRHNFEKWGWSILKFAYFNKDAWCGR